MLGALGAILYSLFVTHEWCSENSAEQEHRENARANGYKTYRDKWGKERYAKTGKRKTSKDYKMELDADLARMRSESAKKMEKRKQLQLNEIEMYKKTYEEDKDTILGKFGLTFEEYFFATHDSKLICEYELFERFRNPTKESLFKIVKYRNGTYVFIKEYLG